MDRVPSCAHGEVGAHGSASLVARCDSYRPAGDRTLNSSRGFNLDHGTDFSTTVAGVPINTPTGAHADGYSDVSFLMPALVSGVQFKKGPYFADEGDFSAAGAANINYVNQLERPIARVSAGNDGWGRLFGAALPRVGRGYLLGALEVSHNDGPWVRPDDYRKVNGVPAI